jgi:hypothetical protein
VKFTPSAVGSKSALLTMTDTAGTQTVNLSGAGLDFLIGPAPGGSLVATVTQGQTATYSLQVSATGGTSGGDEMSVAITCSGAPPKATCSVFGPVMATVATPGAFTVYVSTAAPTQSWIPPAGGPRTRVPLAVLAFSMALLLAFRLCAWVHGSTAWRRHSPSYQMGLARLDFVAPMLLAIILMGCGGGGNSSPAPPPPSGGTPTGNYTLTITGTSNGVSHSQTLTLTVN